MNNRDTVVLSTLIIALFIGAVGVAYNAKEDLAYLGSSENLSAIITNRPAAGFSNKPAPTPPKDPKLEIQNIISKDQQEASKAFDALSGALSRLIDDYIVATSLLAETDKAAAAKFLTSQLDFISKSVSTYSQNIISKIEAGKKKALDKLGSIPPATSTPTSVDKITIISPTKSDSWQIGTKQTIRWSAPSSESQVDIIMTRFQDCPQTDNGQTGCGATAPYIIHKDVENSGPSSALIFVLGVDSAKDILPGQYQIQIASHRNDGNVKLLGTSEVFNVTYSKPTVSSSIQATPAPTIKLDSSGQIQITGWTAVVGASGYLIYSSADNFITPIASATRIPTAENPFTLGSLNNGLSWVNPIKGTYYTFKVAAINSSRAEISRSLQSIAVSPKTSPLQQTAPAISSISPSTIRVGSVVTIKGTKMSNTFSVKLSNGTTNLANYVQKVTGVDDQTATFQVAPTAKPGTYSVTVMTSTEKGALESNPLKLTISR